MGWREVLRVPGSVVGRFATSQTRQPRLRGATRSTAFWIGVVVVALVLMFGAITPNHVFLRPQNLFNIGLSASQIIVLAVGMTFLIWRRPAGSLGWLDHDPGFGVRGQDDYRLGWKPR